MEAAGVDYMLAGSFSSNYYGIPRSTKDAGFVCVLSRRLELLMKHLGEGFELDPQPSFEVATGTYRRIISVPAIPFKIELFQLSHDPHDTERFVQRRKVFDELLHHDVFIPSPEDVIITKLRWAKGAKRNKDWDDARDVIAVQGDAALDWDYIHRWTAAHGTRALLDGIRASIPPID